MISFLPNAVAPFVLLVWLTASPLLTMSDAMTGGDQPAPGQPESRETTPLVHSDGDDTSRIGKRGDLGSKWLLVTPETLFDNLLSMPGATTQRSVTITNVGTLPVRIRKIRITGSDTIHYRLGAFPKLTLWPGESQRLDMTYAPVMHGQHIGRLEIRSNANPSTLTVSLSGVAVRARRGDNDDDTKAQPDSSTTDRSTISY